MSGNHTPTPWAKWQSPDGDWFARAVYTDSEGRRCTAWPAHCAAGGQDNEANADLIVIAVNSYASSQAEIERLRKAHLSIGELPSGMVSKIVGEIVSWGDQCAGGSGREIIPSGPNEGKPYGHTYYEAAVALGALFDDARAALSGSKE